MKPANALPVVDYGALDDDERKHQMKLLKSLHCAYPVLLDGKERFIQVLHARQAGGRIEMDVWLTGSSERVDPGLIIVPPARA